MLEIHETIAGHERIDFDKSKIRRVMRGFGQDVRKEARRRLARRAISAPGQDPGRDTGNLQRSIVFKVSRPGFLVRIYPGTTELRRKNNHWYAAYLYYGTEHLAARANYMAEALEARRDDVRVRLRGALLDSLKPR